MWRDIPGWEGYYKVSDTGEVASVDRVVRAFKSGTRLVKGRTLRTVPDSWGYLRVGLHRQGRATFVSVHRLVLEAFVGPMPAGLQCCHNDGDPANNCLTNLRYDTGSSNNLDTVRHGRNKWANKTHCPAGHPYTPENTRTSGGGRACRICNRAAVARYAARKRGRAA